MRSVRSAALSAAAVLLVGSAGGSVAAESIDVGSTASSPDTANECIAGTTFFQDATATAPSYTTTAGVLTSWSTMATPAGGILELKVGREGPADSYTITGSAQPQQLVADRLNSFQARIPVQAGDVLALYLPPQPFGVSCEYVTGSAGDVERYQAGSSFPDPAVGTLIATNSAGPSRHLNVSARIEPDADADGYGDLTQDACPALKNSHDDCIAPNTFVKSAPKRLTTRGSAAKAKIVSFSSEDGSTFTCTVDKGPAKPCKSAFKVSLKPGKHTVTIRAIDRVGNVDPTPAKVKVKVTKA